MTGAPIDSSIRKTINSQRLTMGSLQGPSGTLDPAPQVIMSPGDEQFAFQYPDNLGDGRDQYQGYDSAGGGSDPTPGITILDFITALIIKPTNRSYPVAFDLPFPVEVTGSTYNFGTGPGSVTVAPGTYFAGSTINVVVTGTTGASAELKVRISTRTNQAG